MANLAKMSQKLISKSLKEPSEKLILKCPKELWVLKIGLKYPKLIPFVDESHIPD